MRLAATCVATLALTAACASPDQQSQSSAMTWECPDGYEVKEGLNTNFPSDGMMRAFIVVPPKGATGPAPVWVPLSGTVESANANLTVERAIQMRALDVTPEYARRMKQVAAALGEPM